MKDPFLLFNGIEFAHRYSGRVIFTIRNPAAFASSVMRLGWRFDFKYWLQQPTLMGTHLQPWAEEIKSAAQHPPPLLEHACLMWRVIHGFIATASTAYPSQSRVVVHEELSRDVPAGMSSLYNWLGLDFTDDVRQRLPSLTSGGSSDVTSRQVNVLERNSVATAEIWRERLTPDEVERVSELTQPEAALFYKGWR